jgi:outer membrane protein TolC
MVGDISKNGASSRSGWLACAGALALLVISTMVASPTRAQDAASGGGEGKRLTLAECLAMAVSRNHTYNQARASAEQSRAGAVSAWSNLLPDVRVSADFTRSENNRGIFIDGVLIPSEGSPLTSTYGLSGQLSQELIDLERLYSFRESRRNWDATEMGLSATRQDVAIDVITRFYEVEKNRRNVELRRESLQLSRDQLRKSEAQFELGGVPKADVLESRVSVSSAERDLIRSEADYAISVGRLNLAIGEPVDSSTEVLFQPAELPDQLPELEPALDAARAHRPDYAQARVALDAASLGRKSAGWATWPTLNGSLRYSKSAPEFDLAYDFESMSDLKGAAVYSYSLSLSVPIFDGLITKGNKIRAAGSYLEAEDRLAQKQQELTLDVREALLELGAARAGLEAARRGTESAQENLRLREAMYDHGAGTLLEMIQARVDLTNARFDLITQETAEQLAWHSYLRATGVDLLTGQAITGADETGE